MPEVVVRNGSSYMKFEGYTYASTKQRANRGYWRCWGYHHHKCKAKMVTVMLNGWPVAKMTDSRHTCMKRV